MLHISQQLSLKPLKFILMVLSFLSLSTTSFSQQKIDSLKLLLATEKRDSSIISTYGEIGDEFYYSGQNDSAIFYWEVAKEIALKSKKKEYPQIYYFAINRKLAVLYNDLAYLKIGNGEFDVAANYFNESILLKQLTNDEKGEIQAYTNLGYLYITKNQIDSAIFYNLTAYKLAKQHKLNDEAAISAMQIGVLHTKIGVISEALKRLNECADYFKKTQNTKALAVAYNNIAHAYETINKNTVALEYFFKSLQLKIENNNKKGAAVTYNNIGACYQKIEEVELAIKYSTKALTIFEELNNKVGKATTLNNIGMMHFEAKKLDSALQYFNQSLLIRKEINDIEGIAVSLLNKSKIHYNNNEYKEAIKNLEEAYSIANEINNTSLISNSSLQLYKNYEKVENDKKALFYYKTHTKHEAILFSEKNLKKADLIQNKIKIQKANYSDSIFQVLQIENNKVNWEVDQKKKNYVIKKSKALIFGIILTLLFLILIYLVVKKRN
jgi:tetratricopeptide (TPR) repeat protein